MRELSTSTVSTRALDASQTRSLAALWASAPEGERFLWDPSAAGLHDAWTLLGAGSAATVTARGPNALSCARRDAHALLSSVCEARDPGLDDLPSVAMFGGAAFALGSPRAPEWEPFGDVRFTLPRWLLGLRGDRAFLREVTSADGSVPLGENVEKVQEIQDVESDHASGFGLSPQGAGEARSAWRALIDRAVGAIGAGGFEKLGAARRVSLHAPEDFSVGAVLQRLREGDPERRTTVFAFERAGRCFVGATPERLVEVRGAQMLVDALAGSVPRVAGEDLSRAQALLASDKDRREHRHVVGAIRAALSELSVPGGVEIPEAPVVKTLRSVMHLFTPIRAELRPGAHVLDGVAALHPTPAVGGVPRAAAVAWITREEPLDRGWYAGPVGWFDARGDGAFAVALRSALVRGSEALVYAGAGIVRGSDPEAEFVETDAKMAPMLAALGVSA